MPEPTLSSTTSQGPTEYCPCCLISMGRPSRTGWCYGCDAIIQSAELSVSETKSIPAKRDAIRHAVLKGIHQRRACKRDHQIALQELADEREGDS